MAEAKRRWSWRSWLPDVGAAFSRLPLAVLLAAFLTLFKLWADNPSEAEFTILCTLAASFLWVMAVDLFVESQDRSRRTPVMAWVAGIAAIALLFRFQWEVWVVVPLLFAALILVVGLSGEERTQRLVLAVQPPALACCRSCADRGVPLWRGPLHHPRDVEIPVRARAADGAIKSPISTSRSFASGWC
jgi:uncharacterized membrane protein